MKAVLVSGDSAHDGVRRGKTIHSPLWHLPCDLLRAGRGAWGGVHLLVVNGGSRLPYGYLSNLSRFGNHPDRRLLPLIRRRDNLPWFTPLPGESPPGL
jgi:hypothetical protein